MPGIPAPTEHLAVPLAPRYRSSGSVLLAWHRFGPYHHARARAAARHLPIVGLEISAVDQVNSWAPVEDTKGFQKITLCPHEAVDDLSASVLQSLVDKVLTEINPSIVVVHGYASRDALGLLAWSVRNGRPVVMMSESNAHDDERHWWREWLKQRLVHLCSAALVGGSASKHYLEQLGLPAEHVFFGYDVVDNAHFAQSRSLKTSLFPRSVPPFFMASARFIEKKNFSRLIQAYALYRLRACEPSWQLSIIGDGPLRPEIEATIASLDLGEHVILQGYKQYNELPAWYGAASCFIHPSTTEQWGLVVNEAMAAGLPVLVSNRCGCAIDLVRQGLNGFTFDPYDVQQMADLMWQIAHGDVDCQAMGHASQEIIANWGPERFAEGLSKAVEAALSVPPQRPSLSDRLLLWALIHR